jgi:hypothetical protein
VRCPTACEDVNLQAEKHPPMVDFTKENSEDRDSEDYSLCDTDL